MVAGGAFFVRRDDAFAANNNNDLSIVPCPKKATSGTPANCVSTASVKQLDLYAAPWTWPDGLSVDEVAARLKGSIATDSSEEQLEN